MVYNCRIREIGRIIDQLHITISPKYLINNVWRRCDQRQIIFSLQPFFNNVHMQQSQKAAAETKAKRYRCFRFKNHRRIVEL